jgi:NAD(P)-dependent dehydrogenase (short-subunit alcohol dehydrogenase family)
MTPLRLGPDVSARCLVIGGCGGIGLEYVKGLVAGGARVAVMDLPASLASVPLPEGVLAVAMDVTQDDHLQGAIRQLAEDWDGLDVFAYVSGINTAPTPIVDAKLSDMRRIIDINLVAAYVAAQAALPHLKRSPGSSMVFVSSSLHGNAEAGFGAYAASKGGMVSLMKVLAREGAPQVRANAIAPGLVETAFLSGGTGNGGTAGSSDDFLSKQGAQGERIRASIPLGRVASPEDIAEPMLFLSGPASRYMTGAVLYVNGGRFTP